MPRHWILTAAIATTLALTACVGSPTSTKPRATTNTAGAKPPATQASTLALTGSVMAPAGVVAAGGGNVVAAGGGNYHVFEVAQSPLAGTRVVLADAQGKPVAGVAAATTDAKGRYSFAKVPAGTYVVVARAKTDAGKDAELRTVVKPGASVNGDIDASSTLSAAFMLEQLGGDLTGFDNATFRKMAGILAANLQASQLPDWSDPGAVLTTVQGLSESLSELNTLVDELAALSPAAKEGTDAAKETLTEAEQKTQEAEQAIKDAEQAAKDALEQAGGTTP